MTLLWTEVCVAFPALTAYALATRCFPTPMPWATPLRRRTGQDSRACELQRDWARTDTVAEVIDIVLTSRLLNGI